MALKAPRASLSWQAQADFVLFHPTASSRNRVRLLPFSPLSNIRRRLMISHAFADLWTILFWLFLGIALGALLVRLLGTRTTSSTQGLSWLDGKTATVREEQTLRADTLEAIEGVGPQIAELLHKHGIHTFAAVAAMSPADIRAVLTAGGSAFAIAQPGTWPFQARLLENGRLAEFLAVSQKLTAGRVPDGGPDLTDKNDFAALASFLGLPAAAVGASSAVSYRATREVSGPLVKTEGLVSAFSAVHTAVRPSLWPLWIGLIGAALLAILCLLHIWCPAGFAAIEVDEVEVIEPPVVAAPVIPQGAGVLGEMRDGRPGLNVYFDLAKSDVSNNLATESAPLKAYLDSHAGARLSVSGFNDPTGDPAFNAELSKARAEKVAASLAGAGIAANRIDLDEPANTTGTGATNADSRRVEVRVKE